MVWGQGHMQKPKVWMTQQQIETEVLNITNEKKGDDPKWEGKEA